MATLTAEQLERIARNRAEAQRRLAAHQAQLRAQTNGSASDSTAASAPALAQPSASIVVNQSTAPQTSVRRQFPSSGLNRFQRTMAQNSAFDTRNNRNVAAWTGQKTADQPVRRPEAIIQYAPSTSRTASVQEVNVSFHIIDAGKFRVGFVFFFSR